jgi:hypothetical protein
MDIEKEITITHQIMTTEPKSNVKSKSYKKAISNIPYPAQLPKFSLETEKNLNNGKPYSKYIRSILN